VQIKCRMVDLWVDYWVLLVLKVDFSFPAGRRRNRRSRPLSFDRDATISETLQEEETAPDLPDSPPRSQNGPLRRRPEYGSQVVYMGSSHNPPPQTSAERELFTCVCGALMANEEITAHMSEECPKRLTLCQYCRKQIGHAELQVRIPEYSLPTP
jgi:hypothetical protein